MKLKRQCFVQVSSLLGLLMLPVQAAVITWSGPTNITADANVITNGNFEYGGYFSASAGTRAHSRS
jgi:hypothetical protein